MKVNTLLQAIREELVPTIIALTVFVPLAYLYVTGGEPPDSLVGIAGLIVGYYYTRSAVQNTASAVRSTAAAIVANGHAAESPPA